MLESLGRYVLVRQLAVGGMGEIFLARQTGVAGFDRPCVVKVMQAELARKPEAVALFLEEARLTAQLTHSHIAQVYDFGKIQGTYFLAIEWVDGVPLSAVMKHYFPHGKMLPLGVVARLVSQAAQGLDYAHKLRGNDGIPLNLVHRDISPSNLLLSKDGMVKIIDFGIAKARTSTPKTQVGEVRGKLRYMSPEQLASEPLDGRSDQYSLGLVLYELVTGRRAVSGRNELEVMMAARTRGWEPVEQLRPDLPTALAAVINKAIAPKREQRFPSMGDFSAALEQVIADERLSVSPASLAKLTDEVVGANPGLSATPLPKVDAHQPDAATDSHRVRSLTAPALGDEVPAPTDQVPQPPAQPETASAETVRMPSLKVLPAPETLLTPKIAAPPPGASTTAEAPVAPSTLRMPPPVVKRDWHPRDVVMIAGALLALAAAVAYFALH